jgi:hypothetical protein
VARITLDLRVLAIQREECRVVKIAQPVHSIMACHAFRSELLLVVCHEFFVVLGMAVDTRLDVQDLQVGWMASAARDCLVSIISLV